MHQSYVLTNLLLVIFISAANGMYGSRILETDRAKTAASTKSMKENEAIITSSKNDTIFFSNAHVTFSSQYQSNIMTPQEEAYFDNALIVAFEQSKLMPRDDTDAHLFMIDAQIVSQKSIHNKPENIIGDGLHRSLRCRQQRYHNYRIYDYSIIMDFGCGNLCGDKSGFWDRRRNLKQSAEQTLDKYTTTLGRNVCTVLRVSPHEIFKTVKECRIRFGV